jgi:hypothetical protein
MSLWFYGSSGNNAGEQMYVLLEDADGAAASSPYPGQADDITEENWQQLHIDLQDFNDAGVDLSEVNSIAVGISGMDYGSIWVDDIRLYPARCVPEYGPAADLTRDCLVDAEDLEILSGDWLESEKLVLGVPADANRLLLWYKFDEAGGYNVTDYSGRELHGSLDGPESGWDASGGYDGGCRVFNDDTAVTVPTDVLVGSSSEITFTVWLNGIYRADYHNWVFEAGSGDFFLHAAVVTAPERQAKWRAGYEPDDVVLWDLDGRDPLDLAGEWHHWAFVKDAGDGMMRIFFDGLCEAEKIAALAWPSEAAGAPFDVGAIISHKNDFIGKMDDFKIYDYALSQAEVVGAATGGGYLFVPAPASDVFEDGRVDFADYAVLADNWLSEQLWPQQSR